MPGVDQQALLEVRIGRELSSVLTPEIARARAELETAREIRAF